MLALIAFVPILVTLVLMMVFNWPAKWSLLISLVMALVFGFFFWDISPLDLLGSSIYGMAQDVINEDNMRKVFGVHVHVDEYEHKERIYRSVIPLKLAQ